MRSGAEFAQHFEKLKVGNRLLRQPPHLQISGSSRSTRRTIRLSKHSGPGHHPVTLPLYVVEDRCFPSVEGNHGLIV